MSIRSIAGKGVNRGEAGCDQCGRTEVVTCDYERRPSGEWRPNEGQILRKITARGWEVVRGALWCPACEAARRAEMAAKRGEGKMADAKSNVEPIRQPDGMQKRVIIAALNDAYDDDARRYRGSHTDRSIADDLGGGVMPGWVAAIREELFGPAGNEEVEAIRAEIAACREQFARAVADLLRDQDARVAALEKRVAACVAAHDKRVVAAR